MATDVLATAGLPPATEQDELAWITQYDEVAGKYADWICACRYKVVYGSWPDGTKPDLPSTRGLGQSAINWLMAQMQPNKWEKALRKAAENGWDAVLNQPYPISQQATAERPVKVPANLEAFPGQRDWLRNHAQREQRAVRNLEQLRFMAAKREPHARLNLYDLRTERRQILAWFEPHLDLVDDAEWTAQFLRLKQLAIEIEQLEADLNLIESLLANGFTR